MRALIAAIAIAVTALLLVSAAQASFPASQGRLLLISEDQGFAAPTLMRGDENVLLGAPVGVNGTAAMSPDGTQIAMVDTVPLFPGLPPPVLIVGSLLGEFDVLPVSSVGGRPTWSPDGSKIAYASSTSGNWDIYVADTSGSAPVDVTASSPAAETEPRWSPDGTKIAFDSNRGGDTDVYTMNPDGSGVTNLTASPAQDTLGDWSPDSQRIVFSSTRTGGGDLYVMGRTGSPVTRLTSDPGADTHAAWSPDGATIAFSNASDGDNEVYRIAPDGSGLLKVTNNATADIVQDWQPLHDTSAPRAHALKSTGRRGGTGRFRFTVQEDSRTASVDVEYSYRTKRGSSFGDATETLRDIRPGHVYGLSFRTKELLGAPKSFRFCVTATDPSANESNRSCARVTLLPKKKKR